MNCIGFSCMIVYSELLILFGGVTFLGTLIKKEKDLEIALKRFKFLN